MTDQPQGTRDFTPRSGSDRRKRRTLADELAGMTREQLIERAMEMWGGWGYTQAMLYKQIRDLEHRIYEQSLAIERAESAKSKLARTVLDQEAQISTLRAAHVGK